MFSSYYPYGYGGYNTVDPDYYRALAEERAAHNQYLAATRAQEQARQRAARARAARHEYGSPYNSYLTDDYDDDLVDSWDGAYTYGQPGGRAGSGLTPRQQRALMEEQRRKELLQLERERDRERLQLEEERRRLEEEKRRHALLEAERRRREQFDPFARTFGWRPSREHSEEMNTPQHHASQRARTSSPGYSHSTPRNPLRPSSPPSLKSPAQSARASPPPTSSASTSSKSVPVYTPEEITAAAKIQATYRQYAARKRAIRAIDDVCAKFDKLRADFRFPAGVDFVGDGETVHVPVPPAHEESSAPVAHTHVEANADPAPRLAYTPANAPLHMYEEELNRLLGALDAVESGGDTGVREHRKETVRMVEREAERLERWRAGVWKAWQEQRKKNLDAQTSTRESRIGTSGESNMGSAPYDGEGDVEDNGAEDVNGDAMEAEPIKPLSPEDNSRPLPQKLVQDCQDMDIEPITTLSSSEYAEPTEHTSAPTTTAATDAGLLRPVIIEEPDPDGEDDTINVEVVEPSRMSTPEPDDDDAPHHPERISTPHLMGGESDSELDSGVLTPPVQVTSAVPVMVVHPDSDVEHQIQEEVKAVPPLCDAHKALAIVRSVQDSQKIDTVGLVNAKWEDMDFDML